MNKASLIAASAFGMLAVVLGAFGAHGLRNLISVADLENWRTAVNYHFFHALALLCLAHFPKASLKLYTISVTSFCIGIILFSGSLYLLSTRAITGISSSVLGPITPIGGLFFILGWLGLLIAAFKRENA